MKKQEVFIFMENKMKLLLVEDDVNTCEIFMKIGYIQEIDLQLNPQCKERFRFREASFTRRISSRGDRVYSKMLALPVDYEEIVDNANIMKKNSKVILTANNKCNSHPHHGAYNADILQPALRL